MRITLLTHARELMRPTNSGRIVLSTLDGMAEQLVWQRKVIDEVLLAQMAQGRSALIYPTAEATAPQFDGEVNHLILIDATWQESRKIYNQSPYLQLLPAWALHNPPKSQYRLRRNQRAEALCTAEVVINLLNSMGRHVRAGQLQHAFDDFNGVNQGES